MAEPIRNEGFRLLEEFICEAIPGPTISITGPLSQGVSEGMTVLEEFVSDFGSPTDSQARSLPTDGPRTKDQ